MILIRDYTLIERLTPLPDDILDRRRRGCGADRICRSHCSAAPNQGFPKSPYRCASAEMAARRHSRVDSFKN